MMYLALKRHLEVITLAQMHVLSDHEVFDVMTTTYSIVDVAC